MISLKHDIMVSDYMGYYIGRGDVMQISRLFHIVYALLEKKTLTAVQLAERLEVSVRTIYRDIEALSQAGIPVYTAQGKGGGIALLEEFVLDKSVLSERERDEILIALQNLSAVRYPEAEAVLKKLGGLFSKSNVSWIEADLTAWGSGALQKETFGLLREAILGRRVIGFTYFNTAGEKRARTVEPVKLLFKDKSWYLKGYCRTKEAVRTFKLTRMGDIRLTGETYTRDEAGEVSGDGEGGGAGAERAALLLKIAAAGAYRVYDDFDEENITRHGDGSFTVAASMPGGEWLYGYLLSYGALLEVVAPGDIRREMARRLTEMAEKYRAET